VKSDPRLLEEEIVQLSLPERPVIVKLMGSNQNIERRALPTTLPPYPPIPNEFRIAFLFLPNLSIVCELNSKTVA
jgi:hypothetical protein